MNIFHKKEIEMSNTKSNILELLKLLEKLPEATNNPQFKKFQDTANAVAPLEILAFKVGKQLYEETKGDCLQTAIVGCHVALTNLRMLIQMNENAPKDALAVLNLMVKEFKSTFNSLLEFHVVTQSMEKTTETNSSKVNPEHN